MAFAAGIFADGILICLLLKFLNIKTRPVKITNSRQLFFAIVRVVIVLPIFFVFVRYGGAFNYANSINFESAERLKSAFLNEAILDDGQAFYRVYKTYKEQQKITDVNITAEELRKEIMVLGGNPQADNIEDAFIRTVDEPKLANQPKNVIVILGESYAFVAHAAEISAHGAY